MFHFVEEATMDGFTNKQIAKITGLTPRAVLFYNQLVPSVGGSGVGRGNVRRYDLVGLFRFLIIKQLADYGITIGKMERILELADFDKIGGWVFKGAHPDLSLRDRIQEQPTDRHCHLVVKRYSDGTTENEVLYFSAIGSDVAEYEFLIIDLVRCSSFFVIALDVLLRQAMAELEKMA